MTAQNIKTPPPESKTKKKISPKKAAGLIVGLVVLGILIWFIFGWLYGPEPSVKTLPQLFQSYGRKNTPTSGSDTLVGAGGEMSQLKIPQGFQLKVFAENLGGPNPYVPGVNWGVRQVVVKNNTVYATIHKEGKVVALIDKNKDGASDEKKVFLENLSLPHGIDIYQDWVYVAENNKVIRVKDADSDGAPDSAPEKLLDLPPLLEHWTRTVKIFPDPKDGVEKMFVSIGSSCSACIESNPWRAAVLRCDLDGRNCIVYASGLRNMVDFTLYEAKIFGTETGKDFIGNDGPPEEINIVKEGKNYGWPYCFGKQVHDITFDRNTNPCAQSEPSFVNLPAHSTAIGIEGYNGNNFPAKYQKNLYVALHGSYQSVPPVGYKVVRVNAETGEVNDFIDGFAGNNTTYGRPVDVANYNNGLLITDDKEGKIYYIEYKS
jgi:glucose/arabinose dehydrogenase